ncbi:YkgJ family cysteine cluster protein [Geoalkalibacter halelectricus]|uniref:YkgJ family cysteine cluster protein n=1 Tax=Geoalkalibacter halelectricus TaxID=2847045 RepID=A0ABY5ZHJ5_9BACT|nr:YkgJ family cysteine cluster protein [Geoalkalibacter halelectricus]MDO3377794.1 YkgJ family cysteine cluster protein [Geoalkalibacter halelectricus]UWZ78613.1 YkgJ family cysteine cluster protein [Geoalkalibacter halelectricus]
MSDLTDLIAAYGEHLAQYDRWFSDCMERFSDRIFCAAGCAGCCRALFDISLLDAALLQRGLHGLTPAEQTRVRERSGAILVRLQEHWPDFSHPYTLNHRPEDHWEVPEEDATPCPFLDDTGRCLAYAFRPATCRLHGLPNVDRGGEIFQAQGCSLNFAGARALEEAGLQWDFHAAFLAEARLYRSFAEALLGSPEVQADTFIAAVPFIDFTALGAPGRRGKVNLIP